MDNRRFLHVLMERRFGEQSCEASHRWLRSVVGQCHVSECTNKQVLRAIRKLQHCRVVRQSTWSRL